jgi:hypothetical protein
LAGSETPKVWRYGGVPPAKLAGVFAVRST